LPPASLVVDVGANIGSTALLGAAFGHRVVAFEPLPKNAKLLEHSAAANNCHGAGNLTVLRLGLADRSGPSKMIVSRGSPAASTLGSPTRHWNRAALDDFDFDFDPVDVRLETGDAVLAGRVRAALSDADGGGAWALKLDCEGYELHALRGTRALLRAAPPAWIVLEFFPAMLRAAGTDPLELLLWLSTERFDCRPQMGQRAFGQYGGAAKSAGVRHYVRRFGNASLGHDDLLCRPRAHGGRAPAGLRVRAGSGTAYGQARRVIEPQIGQTAMRPAAR
jgi:FkbM family methyltransferase